MAKKQSMTERVLNELRNDIINWNYNENDMITEAEISQKFGVSKTPSGSVELPVYGRISGEDPEQGIPG